MIKRFNLLLDKIFVSITDCIIYYKYRIVGFIVLGILVIASSFLPYLNLIFTGKLVIFLILALFFIIFKISWKIILYICTILLIIALTLIITGFTPVSMILGDYIYGFLIIIAIQYFILI